MAARRSPLVDANRVRVIETDIASVPKRYRQLARTAEGHEGRWLQLLAWCAASLRVALADGELFATERDQYLALYEMKRTQLGRIPSSSILGDIDVASRRIWAMRAEVVASCA